MSQFFLGQRAFRVLVLSGVLVVIMFSAPRSHLLSALSTNYAVIAVSQARDSNALPYLNRSLLLDPANPRTLYWLGMVHAAQGNGQAGEAALIGAVEICPSDRLAHLQLSQLYLRADQTTLALQHRREATRGQSVPTRARMAQRLCRNYVMACVTEFDALLASAGLSDADRQVIYSEALDGLDTIRSRPDAERYAREAVQLFPQDAYFHLQLANALLFDRPEEALREAHAVRELGYETAVSHELFGKIYRRMGRWKEAIQAFQRSLDSSPNNAWVRFWLGEAYWNVGRQADAVIEWEIALRIAPTLEEARESLDRATLEVH